MYSVRISQQLKKIISITILNYNEKNYFLIYTIGLNGISSVFHI